jgi:signal peptidase I
VTSPTRSPLQAWKDNVEAVAFALVMALLLRHFVVEVFKIPTSSMAPTLLGDDGEVAGDRIVVDKWAYVLSPPERWHVPVFRYPLDRSRNFIKRIAFLPGEEGRIERGDLWVRRAGSDEPFRVPGKPRDVRETLYVPVYPPSGDLDPVDLNAYGRDRDDEIGAALDAALARPAGPEREAALADLERGHGSRALPLVRERLSSPGAVPEGLEALERRLTERTRLRDHWIAADGPLRAWDLRSFGRFTFAGGAREAIRHAFGITDQTHAERAPRSVSGAPAVDVRVRFSVEADDEAAVEVTWRPGDGREAVLRFASPGYAPSRATVRLPGVGGAEGETSAPLGRALGVDRRHAVELEFVDGEARAWVDGDEVAVLPAPLSLEAAMAARDRDDGGEPQELRISAEGAALDVLDLRVDRDLAYVAGSGEHGGGRGDPVVVPAGSYFLLGDNVGASHDGRGWMAEGVRLRPGAAHGVEEVWWDKQVHPSSSRGVRSVVDVEGVPRSWRASDETATLGPRRRPFVTRDMIVGRAFLALVFWPPKTVPGRFRLIH